MKQTAEEVSKQLEQAAEGAMKDASKDLAAARDSKTDPKATDAQIQARLKTVTTAEMEIHGDRATVALPADEASRQSAALIKLRKVNGDWKIEADSMFGIDTSPAEVTARRVKEAQAIKQVSEDMVKEIAARKYPSAGDAYQAYHIRSNDAVKSLRVPAASQPR